MFFVLPHVLYDLTMKQERISCYNQTSSISLTVTVHHGCHVLLAAVSQWFVVHAILLAIMSVVIK